LEESRRRRALALSLSVGERTGAAIAAYERHEFTAVEEDEGTLLMRAEGRLCHSQVSYEAHSVDASSQTSFRPPVPITPALILGRPVAFGVESCGPRHVHSASERSGRAFSRMLE
jgi:hypothetical protein